MSYLTLHPENWQQHSYIAMNGVYENAVLNALEKHLNLSQIIICTDNDEGGIDAADRLTDILRERGYTDISRKIPDFKDWNEQLKFKNGAEALPAVSHKRKNLYAENISELQYFRCSPDRLIERLSKTFQNRQYRYLAEYALVASAFFIGRNNENAMFEKLKNKLLDEYRAYADKGKLFAKQDDLKSTYQSIMRDLRYTQSRTRDQIIRTSKLLFQLADCAVRCEVEQEMSATEITREVEQCHEITISQGFGGV